MTEKAVSFVLSLLSYRLTPDEADEVKEPLRSRKKEQLYTIIQNKLAKRQIVADVEVLRLRVFHPLKLEMSSGKARNIAAQLPGDIEPSGNAA